LWEAKRLNFEPRGYFNWTLKKSSLFSLENLVISIDINRNWHYCPLIPFPFSAFPGSIPHFWTRTRRSQTSWVWLSNEKRSTILTKRGHGTFTQTNSRSKFWLRKSDEDWLKISCVFFKRFSLQNKNRKEKIGTNSMKNVVNLHWIKPSTNCLALKRSEGFQVVTISQFAHYISIREH